MASFCNLTHRHIRGRIVLVGNRFFLHIVPDNVEVSRKLAEDKSLMPVCQKLFDNERSQKTGINESVTARFDVAFDAKLPITTLLALPTVTVSPTMQRSAGSL